MIVELDRREQMYVERYARDREAYKRAMTHRDKRIAPGDIETLGVVVEYAFSKAFPSLSFDGRIHEKAPRADYVTTDGRSIDIKGSTEKAKWLLLHKTDCDLYVFGRWVSPTRVQFDGWITKDRFLEIAEQNPGRGLSGFGVRVSSLSPMDLLVI